MALTIIKTDLVGFPSPSIGDGASEAVNPTFIYNIPENIGILFEYAANGTPTSTTTMSEREATIVRLLQQPNTNKKLRSINSSPFANILHRGDLTHSFVSDTVTVLSRRSITSADNLAVTRTIQGIEQRANGELTNQHAVYYIIKPIVESGNVQLLSNVQVGGNIGNSSAYFDGTNHYTLKGSTDLTNEISRLSVGLSPSGPMGAFLQQAVQTNYLYGDITGSTFLSGERNRLGTDANLMVSYRNGLINASNVHYSNILLLMDYLASNTKTKVSNVLLPNAIISYDPPFYMPGVYERTPFSVKLSFFYEDLGNPGSNLVSINGNCVSDLSNIGITVTKLSSSEFVVSGSYTGALGDSSYKFVMRDGTIKELPFNTTEDYRALVEFSLPPQTSKEVSIVFDLEFAGGTLFSPTILQSVNFSFNNAVSIIESLVRSR